MKKTMMSNGIQTPTDDEGVTATTMTTTNINGTSISSSTLNSPLMKLSSYFLALRPWSLSASLMPTLLGSALAYRLTGWENFSLITFIFTLYTVILVHGAGNVINTYYDYVKGVDSRGKSDDRILVDQLLTKDEVALLGPILYIAGSVGFALLAYISPVKLEHFALVFFGGLSSSFLYTGGIGLKYIALGDVLILVIFGPVSVLFAFMAQTGFVQWETIYYAIPLALNTEAILHSNNTRDLENDKRAGIVTLAILIGHTASHVLYAFLLFTPYITLVVLALRYSVWFLLPVVTLPKAFNIEKQFRNSHTIQSVPKQTARLNMCLGILYVLSCLLVEPLPYL
ncbi:hypothetical protein PV327_007536 [Microctonus hyperodae]|uniref:1,4-dihydroxy-2-naphthoate octaprenyltransferase n=1 Tax=Microctonus hyperodae TaxID=165561 RepID=A0AA39FZD7_MICHY|nr:hypothetical protein PV327_007536 [Microctonus hyperodae]